MRKLMTAVTVAGLVAGASQAHSAGFALIEQSVSGLGTAYSSAAAAQDPSTVFFNPAGMIFLEGTQAAAGMHAIMPYAKIRDVEATNVVGSPILGSDGGGNAGQAALVPNAYLTHKISDDLAVGLGINAPFGMVTEYEKDWVGRYHGVKSDLQTININPAVAYRFGELFTVGAGFNAQYLKANLTNAVDTAIVGYSLTSNPALLALASNPANDIYADMTADSWGYGYNFGVLYTPAPTTRIGLNYRSKVAHTVKGDVDFSTGPLLNPALAGVAGFFSDQDVSGDITMPATASFNAWHRISDKWQASADLTWTQWSAFEELVINFDGTLASRPSVTTEDWKDTWRYSAGAVYAASDKLDLRCGVAYDNTPVPSAARRTPRIPDADRIWTSIGAGYKFSDRLNLDGGYAHLFARDSRIDKVATLTSEDASRGSLSGSYDVHVDIVSLQLNAKF